MTPVDAILNPAHGCCMLWSWWKCTVLLGMLICDQIQDQWGYVWGWPGPSDHLSQGSGEC